MAGKKKKYNARFPPARIKKIMQTDDEIGKIAAAVPVVISRALELFLESIITESVAKANESNAKTLSSSHIKSVIQSKPAFDFLKTQVTLVPDLAAGGAEAAHAVEKLQIAASKPAAAASPSAPPPAAETTPAADIAQQTPKKRGRMSTSCPQDADVGDSSKPKKRRGRPPKIRPTENPPEVRLPAPPEVPPETTPTPQLPANGEPKQEVKEPIVTATPTPSSPSPSKPVETTVKAEVKAEAVDGECSGESIFTTNTTLGLPPMAKSDLQREAHATNSNSFYRPSHPVSLSTAPQTLYENLSPTSQPMDLSNKLGTPTRHIGPPPQSSQMYNPGAYAIPSNGTVLPTAHGQSYPARDV